MNVMYVCDDRFAMVFGTSLTSLYFHNKETERLDVYVIDDGIGRKSREKLLATADSYGRTLTFIRKPDMTKLLGYTPDTLKWSDNVFCRLYIPTLFADYPQVERVLYIDCDTIICGSLEPLWNYELGGKLCAAGLECMGTLHKRLLGLGKGEPYANAGVLLVDIRGWRTKRMEQKCTEYLQRYAGSLEYLDESTLNGVVRENICIFPPKYNLTTLKCSFTYEELKIYRKSTVMYGREEYQKALKHPVIIHYTDNFLVRRPWVEGKENAHYFEGEFLKNKERSCWSEEPLFVSRDTMAKRLAKRLAKHNRKAIILIAGALHSYGKPIKYFIKSKKLFCLTGWGGVIPGKCKDVCHLQWEVAV